MELSWVSTLSEFCKYDIPRDIESKLYWNYEMIGVDTFSAVEHFNHPNPYVVSHSLGIHGKKGLSFFFKFKIGSKIVNFAMVDH